MSSRNMNVSRQALGSPERRERITAAPSVADGGPRATLLRGPRSAMRSECARPRPAARMPVPDVVACRLPGAAVRRAFLQHTALILLVLAGFYLLSPRAALGALAGAAVLAVAVLAIAYGFTAHRVWVRLSAAGLSSTGYTGRELSIPWSAGVHIRATRRSGYKGHSVVPAQYFWNNWTVLHWQHY